MWARLGIERNSSKLAVCHWDGLGQYVCVSRFVCVMGIGTAHLE